MISFNYKCLRKFRVKKVSLNPLFFSFFLPSFLSYFFSFNFFLPFFLFFISFILIFFLFFFFFSVALFLGGNLPPAGKLQKNGSTSHIVSSLYLKITLPSETTSYCQNASRTSTSIRSKH